MADSSLRASSDAATVTIPAAYADRFRWEAVFTLGSAADTIQETAGWMHKALNRGEPVSREITPGDLAKFDAARHLFEQVPFEESYDERDLTVEGSREALHSAAIGCQLQVADEIKGAAENEEDWSAPLVEELQFWATLREELTAPERQPVE